MTLIFLWVILGRVSRNVKRDPLTQGPYGLAFEAMFEPSTSNDRDCS